MAKDRIYDYRDISNWSYDLAREDPKTITPLPNGWSIVDSTYVKDSEFGAVIFRNDVTKEVVVGFRGTEKTFRDWQTNFALAKPGYKPEEFGIAENYIERAIANAPDGYVVRTTGHSQGGALAHYMGLKHNVPSVGFNSAPGNIYLNEIYKTLPDGGDASHLDFRSSVSGDKGMPMLDSDVVSGLDTPLTHPAGLGLSVLSPQASLTAQGYMDPIVQVDPTYLQTGCKDTGVCHSMENFDDAAIDQAKAALGGGDLIPDGSIVGGDDEFKACFETKDVSLSEAAYNEASKELGEVVDGVVDTAKDGAAWVGDKASDAWDATKDTASDVWDATKETATDAWDATKDTASDVWDATKDAADWTKEKASDLYDGAKQNIGDGLDYLGDKANSLKDSIFGGDESTSFPTVLDDLAGGGSSTLQSFTSSSSGGQSITEAEDEADTEADNTDRHADRAENAARRARSAAQRAAAAAARMRAMLFSRRRAY
jgi:hypothetical protein